MVSQQGLAQQGLTREKYTHLFCELDLVREKYAYLFCEPDLVASFRFRVSGPVSRLSFHSVFLSGQSRSKTQDAQISSRLSTQNRQDSRLWTQDHLIYPRGEKCQQYYSSSAKRKRLLFASTGSAVIGCR